MANKNDFVTIMGIDFLNTTQDEFIKKYLTKRIKTAEKTFVVTANPEIVMKAREDKEYYKAITKATYIVPDGIGIIKAAQWMKTPLTERIAGFDVMEDLLNEANEKNWSCFFLGASEDVNKKMVDRIKKRYPNLEIAGRHHGFFDLEDKTIVKTVQESHADLVFVALGLPRQEMWIANHIETFDKGLFIGVGGSFDVLAGAVKRAPDIWIKWNLEWLYRIIKQPTRLKRIWKVFHFLFLVMLGGGCSNKS